MKNTPPSTRSIRGTQSGFTIIELLISTAVFATVLLLLTIGILQIGRAYHRGVTTTRTQETARAIIDEISQAVQFGSGRPEDMNTVNTSRGECIGNKRFSFLLGRQLSDNPVGADQARHVLMVQDSAGTCTAGIPAQDLLATTPNGRELMNTRMRLARLNVTQVGGSENLYRVVVRVVSGEQDLLEDRYDQNGAEAPDGVLDSCRNLRNGSQFCSASELETVVQKRVR